MINHETMFLQNFLTFCSVHKKLWKTEIAYKTHPQRYLLTALKK